MFHSYRIYFDLVYLKTVAEIVILAKGETSPWCVDGITVGFSFAAGGHSQMKVKPGTGRDSNLSPSGPQAFGPTYCGAVPAGCESPLISSKRP